VSSKSAKDYYVTISQFYQCTTYNFFEDLSTPVMVGNDTQLLLAGLTPVEWADLYHTVFNCQVFFAPLIAICASYAIIYFILSRLGCSITYAN
jgi:hypothetical protein